MGFAEGVVRRIFGHGSIPPGGFSAEVRLAPGGNPAERVDQVARGNLRVVAQPVQPGPSRAYVYRQSNPSSASNCNMTQEQEAALNPALCALESFFNLPVGRSAEETKFTVNLTRMIVTYEDEHGTLHYEDLQEKVDTDLDCMRAYRDLVDAGRPVGKGSFGHTSAVAGRKTSVTHSAPLCRNNEILSALPPIFSDIAREVLELYEGTPAGQAPGAVDAALKRIVAEGKIIDSQQKIQQQLEDRLQELEGRLQNAATPLVEHPALRTQIQAQRTQIQALESVKVDPYALCLALAFLPADRSILGISTAAEMAKDAFLAMIEKKREETNKANRSMMDKFQVNILRMTLEDKIKKSEGYCDDAVALMFSVLPVAEARTGYLNFCRKHSILPKGDCAEDSVMRFIGGMMSTDPNRHAAELLDSAIEGIADVDLKRNCQDELRMRFNLEGLIPLFARIQDAQVRGECQNALRRLLDTDHGPILHIDYVRAVAGGLTDVGHRLCFRDALREAHRILHMNSVTDGIAPAPAGREHTISEKVAHVGQVFHLTEPNFAVVN